MEALALAIPGGLLGLLLATWGVELLVVSAPASVPRVAEVVVDPAVLAFGLLLTGATTVMCALVPALNASHAGAHGGPGHGSRVAGHRHTVWHRAFVVGELALANLLVVAALLLAASLLAATRVDLGFAPEGRLSAQLNLSSDPYLRPDPGGGESSTDREPRRQLIEAVLTRMQATPGVRAAAASMTPPLGGAPNRGVRVEGTPAPLAGQEPTADFQAVSPDYFRTLGNALLEGRDFTTADTADGQPVAIVNQAFVDRYLRGQSALGRVLRFGNSAGHVVVGVATDMRNRQLERPAEPAFFVPFPQSVEAWPYLTFTVWTRGDPAAAAPALRAALLSADPNQPISRLAAVDTAIADQLAPRRFTTLVVGLFGVLALLLATIGAYGVLSLSIAARRREIGVRSALGASPASLRGLLLTEAAGLVAAATAVGAALANAAGRLAQSQLFEVSATSPSLLVIAAVVVVLPALIAASLPAERAVRMPPVDALRED